MLEMKRLQRLGLVELAFKMKMSKSGVTDREVLMNNLNKLTIELRVGIKDDEKSAIVDRYIQDEV